MGSEAKGKGIERERERGARERSNSIAHGSGGDGSALNRFSIPTDCQSAAICGARVRFDRDETYRACAVQYRDRTADDYVEDHDGA